MSCSPRTQAGRSHSCPSAHIGLPCRCTHIGSAGPVSGSCLTRCAYSCTITAETCCSGGGEAGRAAGREARMVCRQHSSSTSGSTWQPCGTQKQQARTWKGMAEPAVQEHKNQAGWAEGRLVARPCHGRCECWQSPTPPCAQRGSDFMEAQAATAQTTTSPTARAILPTTTPLASSRRPSKRPTQVPSAAATASNWAAMVGRSARMGPTSWRRSSASAASVAVSVRLTWQASRQGRGRFVSCYSKCCQRQLE